MSKRNCSVDGCGEKHHSRNLCRRHYEYRRYHGDPLKGQARRTRTLPSAATFEERFWSKVQKGPNCWEWLGAKARGGYGHISCRDGERRRYLQAHRVSYEMHHGTKIPEGLTIDHLCVNPGCVNPDHLEVVTMRENVMRNRSHWTINAKKTHCLRGHPLAGENLRLRPGKYGTYRSCRQCDREYRKRKAGIL